MGKWSVVLEQSSSHQRHIYDHCPLRFHRARRLPPSCLCKSSTAIFIERSINIATCQAPRISFWVSSSPRRLQGTRGVAPLSLELALGTGRRCLNRVNHVKKYTCPLLWVFMPQTIKTHKGLMSQPWYLLALHWTSQSRWLSCDFLTCPVLTNSTHPWFYKWI